MTTRKTKAKPDTYAAQLKRWRQPGSKGFFSFLDDAKPMIPSDKGGYQPYVTEHMIPKARLDEEIGKRRTLETEYAEFADAVLAEIPDHLKPLVPADLGPAQKLKWYREAKKTGVFDSKPNVPETDNGKPATTPKDRDLSTLPAHARIAAGYGKA